MEHKKRKDASNSTRKWIIEIKKRFYLYAKQFLWEVHMHVRICMMNGSVCARNQFNKIQKGWRATIIKEKDQVRTVKNFSFAFAELKIMKNI